VNRQISTQIEHLKYEEMVVNRANVERIIEHRYSIKAATVGGKLGAT